MWDLTAYYTVLPHWIWKKKKFAWEENKILLPESERV